MALALVAAVFAITLPFGAWRVTARRYSLQWFLAIHLPIPFIFLLRVEAGYSYAFIPFTVGACVAGQLVGGRLGALPRGRRRAERTQHAMARHDATRRIGAQHDGAQPATPQGEVPVTPAAFTLGDAGGARHGRNGRADASG